MCKHELLEGQCALCKPKDPKEYLTTAAEREQSASWYRRNIRGRGSRANHGEVWSLENYLGLIELRHLTNRWDLIGLDLGRTATACASVFYKIPPKVRESRIDTVVKAWYDSIVR